MKFLCLVILFFIKNIIEVLVGTVEMWITNLKEEKHSLSTCGQTVYISVLVIHIIHLLKLRAF